MSNIRDFVDNQAEESENDDDISETSESAEPAAKRSKKHKKQISSDEEEEDDDARLREEMRGFVVEESEDEGEGNSEEDGANSEAKSDHDSENDDLLEDDIDLVIENSGRNVGGRVEISDDDDEDDRERIKGALFGHDDFETEETEPLNRTYDEDSLSESDLSEDPFIVHDDDTVQRRRHKGRRSNINDQFLDDAKEIFGVEDIDEFYDEEETLEDEAEEGEESVPARFKNVSLWNTIEPSELAKGFISASDKRIIFEDRPERFQTRKVPVTEIEDQDLDLETAWINAYAFKADTLSKQENTGFAAGDTFNRVETSDKIRETLRFIRNQLFEVPFIAFYRKEYVESLTMADLWKIYQYDEKWCLLQQRKSRVLELFKRMRTYITESQIDSVDTLRKITEKDFNDVTGVQVTEELSDAYSHFQLYYGSEMSRLQEWENMVAKDKSDGNYVPKFKMCGRTDKYLLCIQCGLAPMAEKFGLTPNEFAENFTEYVKHEIRPCPFEPMEAAKEFICENFPTEEAVIQGAIYLLASQFSREPVVRKKLRDIFRRRLKISVYPTKKGRDEIDENHLLFGRHYIKDKPVDRLENDEYLHYIRAQKDGLVEVKLYADAGYEIEHNNTILDSMKKEPIFHRDEFFYVVEEWNKLRAEVLRMMVNDFLVPVFAREAHERLLEESRDYVIRQASIKLLNMLSTEAYKPLFRYINDDNEAEDTGVRVLTICYSSDMAEASFALVIDQDGTVLDHQRLVHFFKRVTSKNLEDARLKKNELKTLRNFIIRRRPHIIGISAEDLEALRLAEDVRRLIKEMYNEGELTYEIPVEITENEVAKVYMNSRMALQEYPEYPPLLKEAVSLARYLLDPLIEVCHLCNTDDDILFVKFHSLQDEVSKRDFLFALHLECINRVNEIGVDINRCLEYPHTAGLLQFVCGLGPRKASHLLKFLKQKDNLLASRSKLVNSYRMGPKVFINACGFIKIDTTRVAERTDDYVEVLDGSRVHPETYEWARKMAVDALELDEPSDPTAALEEILQCPDRLRDLDLDAFAEELARQGFGNKCITLYDIRAELNFRYKDLRAPHKALEGKELFDALVRDNDICSEGKIVSGRVLYIVHRKPTDKDLESRQPTHNTSKNTWECDFCKRGDFTDISQVWNHGDIGQCPGIPVGAKVRLDNNIMGFVSSRNISDNPEAAKNPASRLVPGKDVLFRIMSFNVEKMQCELSCKTSDLQKKKSIVNDAFFDEFRARQDKEELDKLRNQKAIKTNFVKRVISHPSFHNVTFKEAERMLRTMDQGDAVVRPSGKAADYLTVTWKVAGNIFQHINIKETQKAKVFDIGKVLYINEEAFEDLDEIIARYIQPMAGFARDIMSYKYYMEDVSSEETNIIETHLYAEKKRCPTRYPYTLTASSKAPGKFVLSYHLQAKKIIHEYMTVTAEGIRFRNQYFGSVEELINWFKGHYNERPRPPTYALKN